MKVKLKTWRQFKKEFQPPRSSSWTEVEFEKGKTVHINLNKIKWTINYEMKEQFGKKIEVKPLQIKGNGCINYTHTDNKYLWHESWFKKDYYIKRVLKKIFMK